MRAQCGEGTLNGPGADYGCGRRNLEARRPGGEPGRIRRDAPAADRACAGGGRGAPGGLGATRGGCGAMRLPQTGRALVADAVPRDRGTAISVLRRAVELGVNHIDTAASYFSPLRSANELINSALATYPA